LLKQDLFQVEKQRFGEMAPTKKDHSTFSDVLELSLFRYRQLGQVLARSLDKKPIKSITPLSI
jgi:hypothetical protein